MKYTKQLAGCLFFVGLSLSQTSPLLAQEAAKATVVNVNEATLLPGSLVSVRECTSDPVQLFFIENETGLQAGDRVYIIDGNLFADAAGSTLIASNYEEANAAWLASRQASILQMFSQVETTTQEIPAPAVQPPVQPIPVQPIPPEPVRGLW